MSHTFSIFERELASYFGSPVACLFVAAFLVVAGCLAFSAGDFFGRGQADLEPFFAFLPWLYILLAPALSMRLWARERKTGTVELLFALPIRLGEAVVGKFLAAWLFAGFALALTFPMWLTVNLLGRPDNRAIVVGYAGSWLALGAVLAIGSAVSATTRHQAAAFAAAAAAVFALTAVGAAPVIGLLGGWAPEGVLDALADASIPSRLADSARGVFAVRDAFYFISLIVASLGANVLVLDLIRAD